MLNLIVNELYKLHKRRFFLFTAFIILIACIGYAGISAVNDDSLTQTEMIENQLEAEKAYLSQIENIQWESDIEMSSAIMKSQVKIDRLQYMLEHDIATWDWRSDVLNEYYTNQVIISLLQSDENPDDYGFQVETIGENDTPDAQITRLTTLCSTQRELVQEDNFMAYCQSQLDEAQKVYNEQYERMTTEEMIVMEARIESWKLYIQFQTPPYAKDIWKSMAIEQIEQEKREIAQLQYGESSVHNKEDYKRQTVLKQRQIRILEYALEEDVMPLSIYKAMSEYNNGTMTYAGFVEELMNIMYLVMVIGILLGSFLMASEFNYGTIKTLLMYPYRRSAIAAAKLLTLVIIIMLLTLLIPVIGSLTGRFLFSDGVIGNALSTAETPALVAYIKGHIIEIPFTVYVMMIYGIECMKIIIVSVITLTLSTVTQSYMVPTGIMLILSLFGQQVLEIVYNYVYPLKLFRYLLFGNMNLMQYITGELTAPYPSALTSIIVIIVYMLLTLLVYFRSFSRKEIIN